MGEFSLTHLLILAILLLVFFGPSRLPGLGKSIGQAIKGFKQGINEIDAEAKPVHDEPTKSAEKLVNQSQTVNQSQKEPAKDPNKV